MDTYEVLPWMLETIDVGSWVVQMKLSGPGWVAGSRTTGRAKPVAGVLTSGMISGKPNAEPKPWKSLLTSGTMSRSHNLSGLLTDLQCDQTVIPMLTFRIIGNVKSSALFTINSRVSDKV